MIILTIVKYYASGRLEYILIYTSIKMSESGFTGYYFVWIRWLSSDLYWAKSK